MADIAIRMVFNQKTGKKDIWIDVTREEDALPYEHEHQHREIVERLLGEGILSADEVGRVQVGRGRATSPSATPEGSQEQLPSPDEKNRTPTAS